MGVIHSDLSLIALCFSIKYILHARVHAPSLTTSKNPKRLHLFLLKNLLTHTRL